MSRLIYVSRGDITNGIRFSQNHCPVAKALRRNFNADIVFVTGDTIHINHNSYVTPIKVSKRIKKFDWKNKMRPFWFILR